MRSQKPLGGVRVWSGLAEVRPAVILFMLAGSTLSGSVQQLQSDCLSRSRAAKETNSICFPNLDDAVASKTGHPEHVARNFG
jgi:hypothetical protein